MIARELMKIKGKAWTKSYAGKMKAALERHVFPSIGGNPVKDVTNTDLLAMLRAIEKRGTVDMAHRAQQHCGAALRFAIASGRALTAPTFHCGARSQR